jgi:hypothetical protein
MSFILLLIPAFVWNKVHHGRYRFHNFTQRDHRKAGVLGASLTIEDWSTPVPQASHGDVWTVTPYLINDLHQLWQFCFAWILHSDQAKCKW